MLDIYGIGILISSIAGIIFVMKDEIKKAQVSIMILLFILLLKYMGIN